METIVTISDLEKIKTLDETRLKNGYKAGWTYYQAKNKGLLNAYTEFKKSNNTSYEVKKLLTIELVPETCWFSNVRSIASDKEWTNLKKITSSKANYRCEICGGKGPKWPVECHEIWDFNDSKKLQKLVGLIALCPSCHEVKHIGFANTQGRGEIAAKHLATINEWSDDKANKYIQEKFQEWEVRSEYEWELDINYLEQYGIVYEIAKRKEIFSQDKSEQVTHEIKNSPSLVIKKEELVIFRAINETKKKETHRVKSFFQRFFSRK